MPRCAGASKKASGHTTLVLSFALTLAVGALVLAGCGSVDKTGARATENANRGTSAAAFQDQSVPALAGVVTPPASGAYTGVYEPPAPFQISALDAYSAFTDKAPAIVMWYQPWAADGPHDFDPASVVTVYERGATPMITWEPWDPGKDANAVKNPGAQPAYQLKNIIAGKFDPYIHAFARGAKSVRGPVMIRLMHEMNGNWYPWDGTANGNSPAEFVLAWRHVHDIFKQEDATNVTWVWSVNHESVPDTPSNAASVYYPGDAYVDWVSISGFNWGTSTPDNRWRPLDFWYAKPMVYLASLHKPVIVSEFASVEQGGSKAAWLADAYTRFKTAYPDVKAVIYYDKRETQKGYVQDWRISTSAASRDAFRAALANPYYVAAPTTALSAWTGQLTSANWLYLRTLKPVY